jgi:diguanylate cyclase (GGDEF)-like protein
MTKRDESLSWSLTCATDAVQELIRLVDTLRVLGWSWHPSPEIGLDLRTGEAIEPVPLVLPDGSVVGTIRCPVVPTGDPADAALRAMLRTTVLAVAMERRGFAAADRASLFERESRLDPLTGLPNRRLWDEALEREQARCARHGYQALVGIVDLDDLKTTNDTHGHLAGDVLIRVTASALRRAVRDTDTVARLGGDEFGVLAVEFGDGDVEGFAERIESRLEATGVAASVGVAVARPGESLAAAVAAADEAMYTIKRAHKG